MSNASIGVIELRFIAFRESRMLTKRGSSSWKMDSCTSS